MRSEEAPKVSLLVSVDEANLPRFSEVVDVMKGVGMDVERQMETLGIVTGSVSPDKVGPIRDIEGVARVEESRQVRAS